MRKTLGAVTRYRRGMSRGCFILGFLLMVTTGPAWAQRGGDDDPGPAPDPPGSNPPPNPTPPPYPFGASFSQTNLYALGAYAVNIVFLQDGTHSWSDAALQSHKQRARDAADWWMQQTDHLHPNARLAIDLNFTNGGQPVSVTNVGGDFDDGDRHAFLADALTELGYPYSSTHALNDDVRRTAGTNWSFTQYVKPTDGRAFAFAVNGPFAVNFANSSTSVYVHEWGHLFGALDEYRQQGATTDELGGYLRWPNSNAYYLPDGTTKNPEHVSDSLMNNNNRTLSEGTVGQVGLIDTDADSIPDILDTQPRIFGDLAGSDFDAGLMRFAGWSTVTPHPRYGSIDLGATINTLAAAEYRVNGGAWIHVPSSDGVFDDYVEEFEVTLQDLLPGDYTLDLRSMNSVGNYADPLSFDFTVIPEPGSLALFMIGGGMMFLGRRN